MEPAERRRNHGFLSEFVERRVDLPADGQCIVHYGGKYSGYTMKVSIVNGKREGEALIRNGDVLFMKLTYLDGSLTGEVRKFSADGKTEMKGSLVDGMERGLFKEYGPNREVIWMGYYQDGKRYSEVVSSKEMIGFYEERRVSDRELISIAQYDMFPYEKNGRCFEYKYGAKTGDWMYNCGVRMQPYAGYLEDMESQSDNAEETSSSDPSHIKRYNQFLPSIIAFIALESSKDDSLFEYDIEKEEEYGIWKTETTSIEVKWSLGHAQPIVADLVNRDLTVYENDQIYQEESKEIKDLDIKGRRWEGGVKSGKPFGYGVLYDEEGKKEYEGFMMDGVKVCYGIEYSGIECVKYKGCFYEGKRFGRGVLYDRNEMVDCNGLWKNDSTYCDQFDGNRIDCYTESVSIKDGSFNEVKSFILHSFIHSLKRIVIGDNCFGKVRVFELDGLSELESVVIGQNSFRIDDKERNDGSYRIVNCPKLKSIQIGDESFLDYHSFELNNLPSLQSIDIGENCFYWTPSFSLTGLIDGLV